MTRSEAGGSTPGSAQLSSREPGFKQPESPFKIFRPERPRLLFLGCKTFLQRGANPAAFKHNQPLSLTGPWPKFSSRARQLTGGANNCPFCGGTTQMLHTERFPREGYKARRIYATRSGHMITTFIGLARAGSVYTAKLARCQIAFKIRNANERSMKSGMGPPRYMRLWRSQLFP